MPIQRSLLMMKKAKLFGIIALVAIIGSSMTGCPTDTPAPTVTDIAVSPATAVVVRGENQDFTALVAGTNNPSQTVTWSVTGGVTGTSISAAGRLTVAASETAAALTVRATSTANSSISGTASVTVNAPFVPVTGITGVPMTATAGTPLALSGTVTPPNATNRAIVWSVQNAGATGATITGSTLNTTAAGTATVRATITNGHSPTVNLVRDFQVIVNAAFVSVTGITGVPIEATAGTPLALSSTVTPPNATNSAIVWSVYFAGTTGATIFSNTLNTTAAGTAIVLATIASGAGATTDFVQYFPITVNPPFVPVTGITGVPTEATAGTPLALSGTVTPAHATNRAIVWSVQSAGTTGATITGNTLNTSNAGTATVRATIANGASATTNFTQDFAVTVTLPALTGTVSITGTAQVGQMLTADTSALVGSGTITYQWKRGTANIGANSNTYVVQTADIGSSIIVTITKSGNSGSVTSEPIAVSHVGGFTISFAAFQNMAPGIDIEGPSMSILDPLTINVKGAPPSANVRWLVGGAVIGTGSSVTLGRNNFHNNQIRTHFVTLVVEVGDRQYSRRIAVEVTP